MPLKLGDKLHAHSDSTVPLTAKQAVPACPACSNLLPNVALRLFTSGTRVDNGKSQVV